MAFMERVAPVMDDTIAALSGEVRQGFRSPAAVRQRPKLRYEYLGQHPRGVSPCVLRSEVQDELKVTPFGPLLPPNQGATAFCHLADNPTEQRLSAIGVTADICADVHSCLPLT
jgi:hypothetical protein